MTYRRKSEAEIRRLAKAGNREHLSPLMSLWLAIGSAVLIFLFVSLFPARFQEPLGFSTTSLWVALASGSGVFVFLYITQMVTRRIIASRLREEICSVCYSTNDTDATQCPCGGTFEPKDYYEKVERPDAVDEKQGRPG